jgi:enamine deaminase RidA (YjgF/YER057c/UK114 family)
MTIEGRLAELGLTLPSAPPPAGNYVGAVPAGTLVFVAGHGPRQPDGAYTKGKVPTAVSLEQAVEAARHAGLNLLASLQAEIGDLNRVDKFVKVLGMVNAEPDFEQHPKVIDDFSNLMVEIFGDSGRCARSAVGMGSLPFQIPVEVEAVVALKG